VERFSVQRKLKIGGNIGYMGRSNSWGDFDQIGTWGDMVNVITCAIYGDCQLRSVGVARGATLPFPIDLRCRPYNTGHTTV